MKYQKHIVTSMSLSLLMLMGCEPTHIKNGFESEAEMAQLNGMGYEKFEHFQNRGGFESPERAREALSLGYMTNSDYNGNLVQEVTDIGTNAFYQQGTSAQKEEPLNEVLALISEIDDPEMRDIAISSYRMIRQQRVTQGARWSAEGTIYPNLNEAFCEEDALLKAKLSDKAMEEQTGIVCTESNFELLSAVKAKQAKEAEERAQAELLAKQALDKKVNDGGWSSPEEMKEGEAEGFADKDSYVAHLAKQAEKKAAAELEKALLKSAAEAGELAVDYRYCRHAAISAADNAYGTNKSILQDSHPLFTNAEKVLDEGFLREDLSSEVQKAYLAPQKVFETWPLPRLEMDLKTDSKFANSYYVDNCVTHVNQQCQGVELRRALMEQIGVEEDKTFAESQVEFWCGRIQAY